MTPRKVSSRPGLVMSLVPFCLVATLFRLTATSDELLSYVQRDSLNRRYRTSHLGRYFLLAIPSLEKATSAMSAEIIFMSVEHVSTVTVRSPVNIHAKLPIYTTSVYHVTPDKEKIHLADNAQRVTATGVGWAISISSTNDVIVQVIQNSRASDMMQLPPVSSFASRYTVQTIDIPSFVLVIAAYENTLVEYVFDDYKHNSKLMQCGGANGYCKIVLHGSRFHYVTNYDESRLGRSSYGSVSTIKTSKPVLVIQGNHFKESKNSGREALSLTPLYPEHVWGKAYIVPHDRTRRLTFDLLVVAKVKTVCRHMDKNYNLITEKRGQTIRYTYLKKSVIPGGKPLLPFTRITCSGKPFMVVLFLIKVDLTPVGDYGFQYFITPMTMWPSYAMFRLSSHFTSVDHYLNVVKLNSHHILYNGIDTTKHWQWMPAADRPVVFVVKMLQKTLSRLSSLDPRHRFMAVVTAVDKDVALGTALGGSFHFPESGVCRMSLDAMVPGDEIDNDCDYRIDEERMDGQNDDNDKWTDEDGVIERVNAMPGPWMSWFCDASCDVAGRILRLRACDEPPPTNKGQYCNQTLVQVKTTCPKFQEGSCPTKCPLGKFMADCSANCPAHCLLGLCDRYTGRCLYCQKGYRPTDFCHAADYLLPEHPDIVFDKPPTWIEVFVDELLMLIPLGPLALVLAGILFWECRSRRRKAAIARKANEEVPYVEEEVEMEWEYVDYIPEQKATRRQLPDTSIY